MFICKVKCGTFLILRSEIDLTIIFVNYHFAYDKSQTNTSNIYFVFFIFERAEKFEYLTFILILDTNTFVYDQET